MIKKPMMRDLPCRRILELLRDLLSLPAVVLLAAPFVLFILCVAGCGGGGSGSGHDADSSTAAGTGFFLSEMFIARPLFDAEGALEAVVNPCTVVATDPITGLMLEGYPQALFAAETLDTLMPVPLSDNVNSGYKATLVPRNAALVLAFTREVDPDSLMVDEDRMLTPVSPVQLFRTTGESVPAQAYVDENRLIINPVAGGNLGFPASPVIFDMNGDPMTYPGGYLQLGLHSGSTSLMPLRAADGSALNERGDLRGSMLKPIAFNPGNVRLDFIEYGDSMFNGFLPDLWPPRIIREVNSEGVVSAGSDATRVVDDAAAFNISANQGKGEWADGLLVLRPGGPMEERSRIVENSATTLLLGRAFDIPPVQGVDEYLLQRAEYFEPIPGADPGLSVDPVNHPKDLYDPEDLLNSDLTNFVFFDRWDGEAQKWIPVDYDPGPDNNTPIHPGWRISLRFSETMDPGSFRPYETFYICDANLSERDPAFDSMKPGRVTARDNQRIISFEPMMEDPGEGQPQRLIGFGGKPKSLRLVIRVVPTLAALDAFYMALGHFTLWPEEIEGDLAGKGVLGVTDLGGQPLGLPPAFLNVGSAHCVTNLDAGDAGLCPYPPAVDLKYEFDIEEQPLEDFPECGVLVHRFMGLPTTSGTLNPPREGLVFNDHEGLIYGPRFADCSFGLNGYLSGHPVEFIDHQFDEFNTPDPTSPFAPDTDLKASPMGGVRWPIGASSGCRFQHVYRNGDVSPDVPSFEGSILDLIGLSWSPVGGNVENTLVEEFSIGISYTDVVPITTHGAQGGGIPDAPQSGLNRRFGDNVGAYDQKMVVGTQNSGVAYTVDWHNIFTPKNTPNGFKYLPFPKFEEGFPYDSSRSLLIEYRLDPNEESGLSINNGFTYSPGIISSTLPRFRIYSVGGPTLGLINGVSAPESEQEARGPVTTSIITNDFGDNCRYFMIFHYVKRLSTIESPFLGKTMGPGEDLHFLNPSIQPPLSEVPPGAALSITFEACPTADGLGSLKTIPVAPGVDEDGNGEVDFEEVINHTSTKFWNYVGFKAIFEADVENGVVPALDSVAIPYMIE